ncbi:MAG TPA: sigma-54 dependent transcriptional regulator [Vicinamibacteria bacterium]|nr:sigma-54 dependent transcriptional regulator [Vicinamibacteria bacterium]
MSARRASRGRVLVVEDEAYVRDSLVEILRARGYDVEGTGSVADALARLARAPVDVVLTDLRMPDADGLELVRRVQASTAEVPVVVLTGHGTVASAVECLKAGASEYILKPADPEALDVALQKALAARALRREVRYLRSAVGETIPAVGESPVWRRVAAMVEAAALSDATVLLLGESGTGKELLARVLHRRSPRSSGPFVRVNCAAVPLEMWESEFFGHRKGSFTGATADRDGRFQLAHGGTLLLDEVGAMPAAGQAKLLRVIQDGEFDRLGDEQPSRVDVRVVAATNSDLQEEVAEGRFRADLYHRLDVVRIVVPPLRERSEDIDLLARRFAEEIAARLGRPAPPLGPETLARFRAYSWPGNVRELRNVIERALILDPEGGLEALDLVPAGALAPPAPGREGDLNLRAALGRLEREMLLEALRSSGGVRKEAARRLGVDARNLAYYLRKHGLDAGPADPE